MGTVVSLLLYTQLGHVVLRGVNTGPDGNLCQQASLYRGGYNRFTPY